VSLFEPETEIIRKGKAVGQLRDLDIAGLRSRWHAVCAGQRPVTFHAISCFASSLNRCRPISYRLAKRHTEHRAN
jgi:hypothetical protein